MSGQELVNMRDLEQRVREMEQRALERRQRLEQGEEFDLERHIREIEEHARAMSRRNRQGRANEQERHSYLDHIKNYGRNFMIEEDCTCGICLEEFHQEEEVVQLPCSHYFHYDCADQWLERN